MLQSAACAPPRKGPLDHWLGTTHVWTTTAAFNRLGPPQSHFSCGIMHCLGLGNNTTLMHLIPPPRPLAHCNRIKGDQLQCRMMPPSPDGKPGSITNGICPLTEGVNSSEAEISQNSVVLARLLPSTLTWASAKMALLHALSQHVRKSILNRAVPDLSRKAARAKKA